MIKVHNLFDKADDNYINSNKLVMVTNGEVKKLDDELNELNSKIITLEDKVQSGYSNIPLSFILERGAYLLVTIVGATANSATGVHVLNIFSEVYSSVITLNSSSYVDIDLDGLMLTLNRQGSYFYSIMNLM